MVLVKSAQDLCDRVAGLLGVFQTPTDIAHMPSPLIRAIVIPLCPPQSEQALRQVPDVSPRGGLRRWGARCCWLLGSL